MLLACGGCGVRFSVTGVPDGGFHCESCRLRPPAAAHEVAPEAGPGRRPYVQAALDRAQMRERDRRTDRRWCPWIVGGLLATLVLSLTVGPMATADLYSRIVVGILLLVIAAGYVLVIWTLGRAVANDYVALWKCFGMAGLLLAMQVAAIAALSGQREFALGPAAAAAVGGILVYGALARYLLRLTFGRAVLLTIASCTSVALMTYFLIVIVVALVN